MQSRELERKILEIWLKSAKIGDAVHSFASPAYVTSIYNCQSLGQFSTRTNRGTIQ